MNQQKKKQNKRSKAIGPQVNNLNNTKNLNRYRQKEDHSLRLNAFIENLAQ